MPIAPREMRREGEEKGDGEGRVERGREEGRKSERDAFPPRLYSGVQVYELPAVRYRLVRVGRLPVKGKRRAR